MRKERSRMGTATEVVHVNGREMPLEERRLGAMLERLGYGSGRAGIAVAVNGEVVRRVDWADYVVHGGDEIDVVGAVQGG